MIPMYMKEGYSGAYSAIQYGLKGDVVYILDRTHDGMALVMNENGLKFYFHESKLSQTKIERDAIISTKQGLKRKI